MSIDQLKDRIREFRRTKGWNLSQFAKAADLRESTIRRMDDPDWNPESNTLAKLEAVIEADKSDAA